MMTFREDSFEEPLPPRRLIMLPWLIWAVVWILAIGMALYVSKAESSPIYQAEADNAKIVLTDEACKLPAVSNLKKRATWTEKGEVFEGCWGIHQDVGVVVAYFSDRTVVIFPPQIFVPVSGV